MPDTEPVIGKIVGGGPIKDIGPMERNRPKGKPTTSEVFKMYEGVLSPIPLGAKPPVGEESGPLERKPVPIKKGGLLPGTFDKWERPPITVKKGEIPKENR